MNHFNYIQIYYNILPNKAMHRRPVPIINPTPCSVAALLPPRLGVYYRHWPRWSLTLGAQVYNKQWSYIQNFGFWFIILLVEMIFFISCWLVSLVCGSSHYTTPVKFRITFLSRMAPSGTSFWTWHSVALLFNYIKLNYIQPLIVQAPNKAMHRSRVPRPGDL